MPRSDGPRPILHQGFGRLRTGDGQARSNSKRRLRIWSSTLSQGKKRRQKHGQDVLVFDTAFSLIEGHPLREWREQEFESGHPPAGDTAEFCGYSAVVGSITDRIREIRLAGKPPCWACLRTASSSGATYIQ